MKTHLRYHSIARIRTEAIARCRDEHPELSLEEVGEMFGPSLRHYSIARIRAEVIARCHAEHPELSLEEVGNMFGTTRQRVWQIVQAKKAKSCQSRKGKKNRAQ